MKSLVVVAIWVCSVSIAYFVGSSNIIKESVLSSDTYSKNSNVQTMQKLSLSSKAKNIYEADESDKNLPITSDNYSQNKTEFIANVVTDIQKQLSGFETRYDFASMVSSYLIVQELSEDELLQALEHLSKLGNNPKDDLTFKLLLETYATYSPIDAINYVSNNVTKTQLRRSAIFKVLGKWSVSDPVAALNWHQQQEEESLYVFDNRLTTIFGGLADRDVSLALNYLGEISNNKKNILSAVRGITSRLDSADDFENLLERTKPFDNTGLTKQILKDWAINGVDGIDRYVENIQDPEQRSSASGVLFDAYSDSEQSYSKVAAAATAYLAEAKRDEVNARVTTIARRWGRSDPQAAIDWVNQNSGINREQAVYEVMSRASVIKPDFAEKNLALVTNVEQRVDLSAKIYLTLKRNQNQQNADDFLQSLPNGDLVKAKVEILKNKG